MQVRYIGPFDEIELGDKKIRQGEATSVSARLGRSLLEQTDNWASLDREAPDGTDGPSSAPDSRESHGDTTESSGDDQS